MVIHLVGYNLTQMTIRRLAKKLEKQNEIGASAKLNDSFQFLISL